MQVWVYEDGGQEGESNIYVHHDIMLPAFPLCLAWTDCRPSGSAEPGNLAAVGAMSPGIEIWYTLAAQLWQWCLCHDDHNFVYHHILVPAWSLCMPDTNYRHVESTEPGNLAAEGAKSPGINMPGSFPMCPAFIEHLLLESIEAAC